MNRPDRNRKEALRANKILTFVGVANLVQSPASDKIEQSRPGQHVYGPKSLGRTSLRNASEEVKRPTASVWAACRNTIDTMPSLTISGTPTNGRPMSERIVTSVTISNMIANIPIVPIAFVTLIRM